MIRSHRSLLQVLVRAQQIVFVQVLLLLIETVQVQVLLKPKIVHLPLQKVSPSL
jgi:hypothetical protein